jgi:hypothetical protein
MYQHGMNCVDLSPDQDSLILPTRLLLHIQVLARKLEFATSVTWSLFWIDRVFDALDLWKLVMINQVRT